MKLFTFFVLFLLGVPLSAAVFAGVRVPKDWGATNNIQLRIGLEGNETQVKTNEAFHLLVTITNASTNSPFYFFSPAAIYNGEPFTFEVISPSGKEIAPGPPKVAVGSGEKITVRPNQIYRHDFNLGYLCKLNDVGTYLIRGRRPIQRGQCLFK